MQALCEVSTHALAMRARFDHIVEAHELPLARTSISATLSTLRGLVTDRGIDPERTYRTCLLDLRHGIDVVKLTREVARTDELFGIIRWCDDFLGARRTLVARVEAQLVWFVEDAGVEIGVAPAPSAAHTIPEPAPGPGTTIALPVSRHEQEEASPEHRLGMHPSRTT